MSHPFRVGDLVKFNAPPRGGLKPGHPLHPPVVLGYVSVALPDGSVCVDYRTPVPPFEAVLELKPEQAKTVITLVRRIK